MGILLAHNLISVALFSSRMTKRANKKRLSRREKGLDPLPKGGLKRTREEAEKTGRTLLKFPLSG